MFLKILGWVFFCDLFFEARAYRGSNMFGNFFSDGRLEIGAANATSNRDRIDGPRRCRDQM